jgi:hypothetical protein
MDERRLDCGLLQPSGTPVTTYPSVAQRHHLTHTAVLPQTGASVTAARNDAEFAENLGPTWD